MDQIRTQEPPSKFPSIPRELLLLIFSYASGVKDPFPFPLTASAVCRYWRETAIGSPSLWTGIYCTSWSTPIDTFVQRSQPCLMDVILELPLVPEAGGNLITSHLQNHIDRLRSLQISLLSESYLSFFLPAFKSAVLPNLARLHVSFAYPRDWHDPAIQEQSPFDGCSQIQSLTLSNTPSSWIVPSAALTQLDLNVFIPFSAFCELFISAPSLSSLILRKAPREDFTQPSPASLPALSLHTLAITLDYVLSPILSSLSMPNLEVLEVARRFPSSPSLLSQFPIGPDTSTYSKVHTVSFQGMPLDPGDVAFLQALPALSVLQLLNVEAGWTQLSVIEGQTNPCAIENVTKYPVNSQVSRVTLSDVISKTIEVGPNNVTINVSPQPPASEIGSEGDLLILVDIKVRRDNGLLGDVAEEDEEEDEDADEEDFDDDYGVAWGDPDFELDYELDEPFWGNEDFGEDEDEDDEDMENYH